MKYNNFDIEKFMDESEKEHYKDIIRCVQYIEDNELRDKFKESGVLLPYSSFPHSYLLPHDYVIQGTPYILYFDIDIHLIHLFNSKHSKIHNRWKLNSIQTIILHGWKTFIHEFINKKMHIYLKEK